MTSTQIKTIKALSTLTLSAALAACGPGAESPVDPVEPEGGGGGLVVSQEQRILDPQVPEGDMETLEQGNTAFAFDLYDRLRTHDPEGNLFFSPYSISIALAMTYEGARGETADEMAAAMRYLLPRERLHPAFNKLDLELESRGEGASNRDGEPFQLSVANSIWGQQGYPFEAPFLDAIALNYGAGLRTLDLQGQPEPSRDTINAWVEDETEDRIQDLLPQGSIDASTVMVLVNAIYFNGSWAHQFEEQATSEEPFHMLDGSERAVAMMHQSEQLLYGTGELGGTTYQAVSLPYEGGELSMTLIVPEDLASFEAAMDPQGLEALQREMTLEQVEVAMPKFKVETDFSVKKMLIELGMERAFGAADFTGISAGGGLQISDVLHEAFGLVDETGTEAAAATAVVVREASAVIPPDAVEFRADRPFLVLIRDHATGTILFMGRIAAPTF